MISSHSSLLDRSFLVQYFLDTMLMNFSPKLCFNAAQCLENFRPIHVAVKKLCLKRAFFKNAVNFGQPWQIDPVGLKFFIHTFHKIDNIITKVESHTSVRFWLTSIWNKFSSFGQCFKYYGWNFMYNICTSNQASVF